MKIALLTPWKNAWIPLYKRAFESRGHDFMVCQKQAPIDSDVVLHGWAVGTPCVPKARNIVFLRRYELFDGGLAKVDWKNVHSLICVNDWIASQAKMVFDSEGIKTPVHTIYNTADPERWSFAERGPGKKIGMACFIHPKKNLPLALQVVAGLPRDYELHIAGDPQDLALMIYLTHMAEKMGIKLFLHGQVEARHLNEWWEDKSYCLSTSISEGNPNNVIEAMAKGIKPVVHNWPGAEDQFPECLFNTAQEAVKMILEGTYDSKSYRGVVESEFSMRNIDRVVDLALDEERSPNAS